jgi:hypothetical protein
MPEDHLVPTIALVRAHIIELRSQLRTMEQWLADLEAKPDPARSLMTPRAFRMRLAAIMPTTQPKRKRKRPGGPTRKVKIYP